MAVQNCGVANKKQKKKLKSKYLKDREKIKLRKTENGNWRMANRITESEQGNER